MTDIKPKRQKHMLTLYDDNSKNDKKGICSHGTSLDRPQYSDVNTTRDNPTSIL